MNSLKTRRSNHLVLSIALTLVTMLFTTNPANAQQLQRGISVELAVTNHATPVPDADNADAWIITVTADGDLYFGIDQVTPESLTEEMKSRPRNRETKLYIKADARSQFSSVENALQAGRANLFDAPILLTSQPNSAEPGTPIPPEGLEVMLALPTGAQPILVQFLDYGQTIPTLRVNNLDVPANALQTTLTALLQNRSEKVVAIKAPGAVPFAPVAHVVDVIHSLGAGVILPAPSL